MLATWAWLSISKWLQAVYSFLKGPPWQVRRQAGQEFSTVPSECRPKQRYQQRPVHIRQPNRLSKTAPSKTTHGLQSGVSRGTHCRDWKTITKTSNQSSQNFSRQISEPNFPGAQGRRILAPSNQSSWSKLTHCPAPLQDGGSQDSEGSWGKGTG